MDAECEPLASFCFRLGQRGIFREGISLGDLPDHELPRTKPCGRKAIPKDLAATPQLEHLKFRVCEVSPLLFGPEGMRRSKVHAAGVLRMKPAAYYHIAN